MIRQVVAGAALVIVVPYLLYQVRKPTRWVGRFVARGMNQSHSSLTDWGLSHAGIERDFTILDVGCGGGRTIRKLAEKAPGGKVFGVDYSIGSVETSRDENAALIAAGRVEVRQASVSQLPFPDATFDLVTAVETHYYWPDLVADLREVLRVLKPGGELIIIAESYKSSRYDFVHGLVMKALRGAHLTLDEHRELLAAAGFQTIELHENRREGWMCVTGKKEERRRSA